MLRFLGIVFALIVMLAPGQARADCTFPAGTPGSIVYNQTEKIFQYCADNVWKSMNPLPGTGTGGCTAPNISEGKIIYNTDHRVMQGCAGNVHRPFGKVGGLNEWKDLSAGVYHTCGIKNNGTLWCWGAGISGQLGAGNTTSYPSPTRESSTATNWHSVGAGGSHTCAIKTDGSLWCWGLNGNGQLGTGNTNPQTNPTRESSNAENWRSVTVGNNHSCAIKTDGSLWCWGTGFNGQLGTGNTSQQNNPTRESSNAVNWLTASAGSDHTCAVKNDGSLWCWGTGSNGQLGTGNTNQQLNPTRESSNATNWHTVSSAPGASHACAVKTDGSLWCWGYNGNGALGTGNTNQQLNPAREFSNAIDWHSINIGGSHSCAIKTDGSLWCWGHSGYGQLGTGNTNQQSLPTRESSNTANWASVKATGEHTCAIRTDGSLWCWGNGAYGRLGTGNTNSQTSPTREVSNATNWGNVTTGNGHTCAIKADRSLWCWGTGDYGRLGTGNTNSQTSPTREVSNATNWSSVSAGNAHTCAVKTDGSLWCWGYNSTGQLGTGNTNQQTSPTREVSNATNWSSVSAGNAHTCAIKADGSLWCWGAGSNGQLGTGNTTSQQTTPAREVSNATNWRSVSAGPLSYTCAIKTDGSLWCWGAGSNGQLGTGNTTQESSPVRELSHATDWENVSTGGGHTCAVKTDQSIWCWGTSNYGQLGAPQPKWIPNPTICSIINGKEYKAGDMFYNVDHKTLQYCDSAGWVGLGKAQ